MIPLRLLKIFFKIKLAPAPILCYSSLGGNDANHNHTQPHKIMFDSENPENFVNGAESIAPEMNAVNGTDDGISCGGEDDALLAYLKANGF